MCQQQDEPPTAERYEPLKGAGNCDYCPLTIRMAIYQLGPAECYCLAVHPAELQHAARHLQEWTSCQIPLVMNVYSDPANSIYEWYLSAGGRSVGSKGA